MRQRYLALLSVFASLPAMALTFQTRLESIEWTVEGDKFECRLTQPITDFGSGEFVRRAGEQAIFRLKAYNSVIGGGSATLLAAAAPWQPGRGDINLGSVNIGSGTASRVRRAKNDDPCTTFVVNYYIRFSNATRQARKKSKAKSVVKRAT